MGLTRFHLWRCSGTVRRAATQSRSRSFCSLEGRSEDSQECGEFMDDEGKVRKRKLLVKELVKAQIREDIRKQREERKARAPRTEEQFMHEKIRRSLATIDLNRTEIRRKYSCHLTIGTECLRETEALTKKEAEHYQKIGNKNKNFASVGKRGIYAGVVHNIHTNWKFHETVRVECPRHNSMEATERLAAELARLSGGIVLNILEDRTVILFRGKNYTTPLELYPPEAQAINRRKAVLRQHIEEHLQSQVFRLGRYVDRYRMLRNDREVRESQQAPLVVKPGSGGRNFETIDDDPCSESEEDDDSVGVEASGLDGSCKQREEEDDGGARRRYARELARHTPQIRREKREAKRKLLDYKIRKMGGVKCYLRGMGVSVPFASTASYS